MGTSTTRQRPDPQPLSSGRGEAIRKGPSKPLSTFRYIGWLSVIFFGPAVGHAEEAANPATADYALVHAVAKASKAWKDAFNSGDARRAAMLYEEDAVMVAKPFGTYKGRAEIEAFWENLIAQGFDDVVYDNTTIKVLDKTSARVSADWEMNNAAGTISNELWVLQSDGRALLREDHFEVAQ